MLLLLLLLLSLLLLSLLLFVVACCCLLVCLALLHAVVALLFCILCGHLVDFWAGNYPPYPSLFSLYHKPGHSMPRSSAKYAMLKLELCGYAFKCIQCARLINWSAFNVCFLYRPRHFIISCRFSHCTNVLLRTPEKFIYLFIYYDLSPPPSRALFRRQMQRFNFIIVAVHNVIIILVSFFVFVAPLWPLKLLNWVPS